MGWGVKLFIDAYERFTGRCWHDWIWTRAGSWRGQCCKYTFIHERTCVKCGDYQTRIGCLCHTGSFLEVQATNPAVTRLMQEVSAP